MIERLRKRDRGGETVIRDRQTDRDRESKEANWFGREGMKEDGRKGRKRERR